MIKVGSSCKGFSDQSKVTDAHFLVLVVESTPLVSAPNSYGFIAQLVEHCTGIAEVTGSNPAEA